MTKASAMGNKVKQQNTEKEYSEKEITVGCHRCVSNSNCDRHNEEIPKTKQECFKWREYK